MDTACEAGCERSERGGALLYGRCESPITLINPNATRTNLCQDTYKWIAPSLREPAEKAVEDKFTGLFQGRLVE